MNMLDIMNSSDKLSKIEEKMKERILKIEIATVKKEMKKFPSLHNMIVGYEDDWLFIVSFGDEPKRYLHIYFTFPRGTKKKPDKSMRFINDYVMTDIMIILASVFPKHRAEFSCVRIDDHQDVWQFDVYYK